MSVIKKIQGKISCNRQEKGKEKGRERLKTIYIKRKRGMDS